MCTQSRHFPGTVGLDGFSNKQLAHSVNNLMSTFNLNFSVIYTRRVCLLRVSDREKGFSALCVISGNPSPGLDGAPGEDAHIFINRGNFETLIARRTVCSFPTPGPSFVDTVRLVNGFGCTLSSKTISR